jgi:hypothetical protein
VNGARSLRAALALALAGTSLASIVTGLMPESIATGTLIATRILLGVSQAAIFPVVALAVSQFVAREQGLPRQEAEQRAQGKTDEGGDERGHREKEGSFGGIAYRAGWDVGRRPQVPAGAG